MENEIKPEESQNEVAYKTVETGAADKPVPASIRMAIWCIGVYVLLSLIIVAMLLMRRNYSSLSSGIGMVIWIVIAVGLAKKSMIAWWGAMIYSIIGMAGTGAALFIGKGGISAMQIIMLLVFWAPLVVIVAAISRKSAREYVKKIVKS